MWRWPPLLWTDRWKARASLFSPQVIYTLTSVAHHKELRGFSNPRLGSKAFLPSRNPNSVCVSSRIESRIWKRYLHSHVCSSIIHSRQEVQASSTIHSRQMDKQSVIQLYNGILCNLIKEGKKKKKERKESLTLSTPWVNLVDIMLSEKTTHKKDKCYVILLH